MTYPALMGTLPNSHHTRTDGQVSMIFSSSPAVVKTAHPQKSYYEKVKRSKVSSDIKFKCTVSGIAFATA
jgi:hypothetical protein